MSETKHTPALFVAAPDLLEALKVMLTYATTADSRAVSRARAAIDKAEGRQ